MPSVIEILKQAGIGEEDIKALDQRTITAFNGVLSEAQGQREQAELAKRSYEAYYNDTIAPALLSWDSERSRQDNEMANVRAENAFYRAQNDQARASGFVPSDAPTYQQPRDGNGRYVAGAPGGTPGSPQYFDVSKVYERAGDAVGILTDIQWEHQRLFNQPLPISPTELVRRADAVKMDPRSYAAREYNWEAKRAEQAKKQQDDHDNQIRKEAEAARDRAWAERVGSNPDIRMGMPSKYSDNARAVKAGTMPDPLLMDDNQRRQATRSAIRADLQEAEK